MAGKGAKESFLGAMPVGHHRSPHEIPFYHRPERQKGGRIMEIFGGDAVDLTGRPGDVLITLQKRNEGIVDSFFRRPGCEANLHRSVGASFGSARRFEIDGSENGVANLDEGEIAKVAKVGNGKPTWSC